MRLTKKDLAQRLGGSFVLPSGKLNSKKLADFVTKTLCIDLKTYQSFRVFTNEHVKALREKNIIF
jgi:hypothetical protein